MRLLFSQPHSAPWDNTKHAQNCTEPALAFSPANIMERERSREIKDHYQGVIIMLEHGTETGWKGSEGLSEESVGKMYFCCLI